MIISGLATHTLNGRTPYNCTDEDLFMFADLVRWGILDAPLKPQIMIIIYANFHWGLHNAKV